jgi:hypothetical protein
MILVGFLIIVLSVPFLLFHTLNPPTFPQHLFAADYILFIKNQGVRGFYDGVINITLTSKLSQK